MTYLEKRITQLHARAVSEGISIYNTSFSETKKAASVITDDFVGILLDHKAITSDSEECYLLMEEMAHHDSGAFYLCTPSINEAHEMATRRRAEAKARNRMLKDYIPYDELVSLLCSTEDELSYEEIADHFCIPIDIVVLAFDIYRQRGLL
jgi:hypothetical protein